MKFNSDTLTTILGFLASGGIITYATDFQNLLSNLNGGNSKQFWMGLLAAVYTGLHGYLSNKPNKPSTLGELVK